MSPLQKTTIDVPLGGLDKKFDPKLLPVGKLLQVENGEFGTAGSITKRNGYTALPMGSIASARQLMSHGERLLLVDNDTLYQYLPSQSAWGTVGYMPPIDVRTRKIGLAGALDSVASVDCCKCGSVILYAWITTDGKLYVYAIDSETGATIKNATQVDTNYFSVNCVPVVRTITDGTNIVVVAQKVGATLQAFVYDPATVGTVEGTQYALAGTGSNGNSAFDADAQTGGAFFAAWVDNSNRPCLIRFTSAGTVTHSYVQETPITGVAVSCTVADTGVFVLYVDASKLKAYVRSATDLTQLAAETSWSNTLTSYDYPAACRSSTNKITWALRYYNGTYRKLCWGTLTSGGVKGTISEYGIGMYVASKPFAYNGQVLALVLYSSRGLTSSELTQNGHYLIRLSDCAVVAKVFSGESVSESTLPNAGIAELPVASAVPVSSTAYEIACLTMPLEKALYTASGATRYLSTAGARFDFAGHPSLTKLGENLHINAGIVWEYDGQDLFENGFHVYPEKPTLGTTATGGALSDGTYQVAVVYAWFDAAGQFHRSAPSVPASITLSGGGSSQKITVTVNNLQFTSRPDVRIIVYATAAGGSVFYETVSAANSRMAYSQVINITTAIPTTTRQLYTTDGTLEFAAPPAFQSLVRKGNRLYGVTHDGALWYSHERITGEAVAFSEYLTKTLRQDGGDYYQAAVLNDTLAIFGESSIQAVFGSGPARNGTSDDLTEPKMVVEGIGILDGTPACGAANGVWFKSSSGLSLLTPSLAVDHSPGVPVESYNGLVLTSIVSVPSKQQVRFGHSDGETLVFDLGVGAWSTFSNHNSAGACYWNGGYCLAKSTGAVWQQSTGFLDDATVITLTIDTPWIKIAGLQGYQRIYYAHLLAVWRAAHTLSTSAYYDYSETVAETATHAATVGYSAGQIEQVRHYCGRKCEAMRLRITETGATGESFTLSGIALEIGVKGGLNRLATTKTI